MTSTHYPTDLTNAQWENLLPYLPEPSSLGRPPSGDALNYQRYVYIVKSGSMANAPSSDATVANGLFPLQKVEN